MGSYRALEFSLPEGMTGEQAAKAFSAYLQGPLIFEEATYPIETEVGRWQLDGSNDFWLRVINGAEASLGCCTTTGREPATLRAMLALFDLRYPPPRNVDPDFPRLDSAGLRGAAAEGSRQLREVTPSSN